MCRLSPGDQSVTVQPSGNFTQLFESRGTLFPGCSNASWGGHDEILLCIPTFKETSCKLEQVWMTHLINLMDFDSFQPVTGVPPLGCVARRFLAIVVLSWLFIVTKTIWTRLSKVGRCQKFQNCQSRFLVERKQGSCRTSTFVFCLSPFGNFLVRFLFLLNFSPPRCCTFPFFVAFLSFLPLFSMTWCSLGLASNKIVPARSS